VDGDPQAGVAAPEHFVIRLERVPMPAGLKAVAHLDPQGDLIIYISDALDADGARAAVRVAIRAWRRTHWRTRGLPPAGVALLLALPQLLRGAARALRAKPAAWAAAATALAAGGVAAAIFITSVPHQPISSGPGRPPAFSSTQPHRTHGGPARQRAGVQPVAATPSAPGATSVTPKPARTPGPSGHPSPAPPPARSPSPSPSPEPSQSPSPSPTPSPSGGKPSPCVTVLVVRTCIPSISLSLGG
jgi:hypothetical protein